MVQGRAMPDQPCIDAKLLELRLPAGDQAKLGKVFALGSVFEKNQAGMQRQQPFAIANDAWRQTCITQQPFDRRTDSFQKADAGKQGVRPNQFDLRHSGQMSPVVQWPADGRDVRIFFHASWRRMTRTTMLILLSVSGWADPGERSSGGRTGSSAVRSQCSSASQANLVKYAQRFLLKPVRQSRPKANVSNVTVPFWGSQRQQWGNGFNDRLKEGRGVGGGQCGSQRQRSGSRTPRRRGVH